MPPPELQRGGNTVLGPVGGALSSVVVGVSWESGALECDVCALVCGPERKVLDDQHFLFWGNTEIPNRSVFLRTRADGGAPDQDRAQVLVALDDLPPAADRLVVTLSTIVPGAHLRPVENIRIRVWDPVSGAEAATYSVAPDTITTEACLVLTEVYRHAGNWKVKAVGQGYGSGLAGLSSDYGVNVVD
jgi:tellurium resistance protein TerD